MRQAGVHVGLLGRLGNGHHLHITEFASGAPCRRSDMVQVGALKRRAVEARCPSGAPDSRDFWRGQSSDCLPFIFPRSLADSPAHSWTTLLHRTPMARREGAGIVVPFGQRRWPAPSQRPPGTVLCSWLVRSISAASASPVRPMRPALKRSNSGHDARPSPLAERSFATGPPARRLRSSFSR